MELKEFYNEVITLLEEENALKILTNVHRNDPVGPEVDKQKIERYRNLGLIEKNALKITDMGKIFILKKLMDYADNITNSDDENDENDDWDEEEEDEFDDENFEEFEEDEDFDEEEEDWEEDDEDWDEDDENSFEFTEDDWDEDNDEDENYKGRLN